jgi:hypothetical protein
MKTLLIGGAFVLSFLNPVSVLETPIPPPPIIEETPKIEVPAVMVRIAKCESPEGQFHPDGTLVRGKTNPNDVGKYQINETCHLERAQKMGMDIHTEKGNEEYAMFLYRSEGTTPWNNSKSCWDK